MARVGDLVFALRQGSSVDRTLHLVVLLAHTHASCLANSRNSGFIVQDSMTAVPPCQCMNAAIYCTTI